MKRGKDEGKITGPMFPRLHVNDTEKGGPRAPPRNKMALYEQLSVPSQRFNQSARPANSNSEHASGQDVANERSTFFSYQLPTDHQSEKIDRQFSDFGSPLAQVGQKKKSDEEDFRVPIFNYSVQSQECGKGGNGLESEKVSLSNTSDATHSLKFHKYRKMGKLESSIRQVGKTQPEESSKEIATDRARSMSNSSSIQKAEGLKNKINSSKDNRAMSQDNIQLELRSGSEHAGNRCTTSVLSQSYAAIDERNSAASLRACPSRDDRNSRDLGKNARRVERSFRSVPMRNLERADSVSEISVMDSIATVDMTPDDVVGVIGQKHFWKARKAILNNWKYACGSCIRMKANCLSACSRFPKIY